MARLSLDRIATVTDEVDLADPARAVRCAATWGIRLIELRSFRTLRVPDWPEAQVESLVDALRDAGSSTIGVSPGFFKVPADAARVRQAIDFAVRLGAPTLTFFAGGDDPFASLRAAADACRDAGIEPLLENSASSAARRAADILALADHADVGLVWDPANAAVAGERSEALGLPLLARRVRRVHVKSVDAALAHCVDVGEGLVDWPAQLRLLANLAYAGPFTIEPHREHAVERNLRKLLAIEY
jgi:sugar phosphate isomerase/epimerase